MSIKQKLMLNMVMVLIIVLAVATASLMGMRFVKSKLQDLTNRSTPYQTRTLELQRAIQGATTELVKVGTAQIREEYTTSKHDAETALDEVKKGQQSLNELGGNQRDTEAELRGIAQELFETTASRLKAEEDASAANKVITQRLNEGTARLKELDAKIRGLQSGASTSYVKSMETAKDVSSRVRDVESLRSAIKDYQLAYFEIQKAAGRKAVLISQSKANSALNRAQQNEYLKYSPQIVTDLKFVAAKTDELVKTQTAIVGQAGADTSARDGLVAELTDKLNGIILAVEQEVATASEHYATETGRQGNLFGSSTQATSVLVGNSELVSLGLTAEGLTTRLCSATSPAEVVRLDGELQKTFARITKARSDLERSLKTLKASGEIRILHNAAASLEAIRSLIFASDGVLVKIRNQLAMQEKAKKNLSKLREVVQKQTALGKETITVAQAEQGKAIVSVNKVVTFSTSLIVAICIASVVIGGAFGLWVYRSIARPLQQLLETSQRVANGDLSCDMTTNSRDEVGKVQEAVGLMVVNLRQIVGKIVGATSSLASSSEELSATAHALEQSSIEQSSMVEQSSTAMTEMTQTIGEVAQNSTETSTTAEQMRVVAENGKSAMHQTAQELNRFADTVKTSALEVESLGQQSEEISSVVTLIRDIADQTNLLALNAAIEAARAGDQGRGFAVVADSVRKLAESTTAATEDISRTVKTMQTGVSKSVLSMQQERQAIEKLLEHIGSTLGAIDLIVQSVEQVTGRVHRIAVAAEEQSATSCEISNSMESIHQISRELRLSFGDIKKSSEDLSGLANDLNSMVTWFKV